MSKVPAGDDPPRRGIEVEGIRPAERGALDETIELPPLPMVAPVQSRELRQPEEVLVLWRQRLRLAALLMFGGAAIFLARRGLQIYLAFGPTSETERFLLWNHVAIVSLFALFSLLLWSRRPSSFYRLCVAEFALFGAPAALLLAPQYFITVRAAYNWNAFTFSGGPWLLLIFIYALFIPSTLRRATAVIATIAAAPILLILAMYINDQRIANTLTVDDLAGVLLTFILAAICGIIGVDKISSLRQEALRALQLGQYHLKEQIGSGGMGEVFLAEHAMLKRPCVVKLIRRDKVGDDKVLARFHREVQATARLSHWNTVEILDYGRTEDGTLYYVMQHLPGMTLAEMVEKHGRLPPERAAYLLLQVCDALREAHQSGLVHRDIKPGNIFIAKQGGVYDVVKLLDFGLVKPLVDDQPLELTVEGAITGSPMFMSPEQAVGETTSDARSDIYSLGAVAYYLLTGRPPFCGDNVLKLVIAHSNEKPVPPSRHNPEVPEELDQIVLKCLAKAPSARFQTAVELSAALTQSEIAARWSREKAALWWRDRVGRAWTPAPRGAATSESR